MKKAIQALIRTKWTDAAVLLAACLAVGSGWFDLSEPRGHDAISTICGAAQVKSFLTSSGCEVGSLQVLFLDTRLFHSLIAGLSSVLTWLIAGKMLLLAFFALSSVFAYCYVWELTRHRLAAFIAGLAYAFAPYYFIEVVFEGHWSLGAQYMMTPLVFLATERAFRHPRPFPIILAGLSLALLIALGHPQTFLLVGPFWVLYVIFRTWLAGKPAFKVNAVAAITMLTIGLSLTAFWWLPLIQEIEYFHAGHDIAESVYYRATFLEAITLRPELCCSPGSSFEASTSLGQGLLRLIPFILVCFGLILNRKNRYIWFFSLAILITWILSLGTSSPLNLFGFLHNYVPLFSWTRTPFRFLLLACFFYAIVIGFLTKWIVDWLRRVKWDRWKRIGLVIAPVLLASLIIMNTWSEGRAAFSTFDLPEDTGQALQWLEEQPDGDYRIADLSFDTESYYPTAGRLVNPTYWVFAHGKETLPGGLPETSTYLVGVLNRLRQNLETTNVDLTAWLNVLNVRYVVVDKTNPAHSNAVLGESLQLAWTSDTIDIYENVSTAPRVFVVTPTGDRPLPLWDNDQIKVWPSDAGIPLDISLDSVRLPEHQATLKVSYWFTQPQEEWGTFALDAGGIEIKGNDVVRLAFYSDTDIPDMTLRLDIHEADGSAYGMDLLQSAGIKAGWNEVSFPVSLLLLQDSADQNGRLDLDDVSTISVGIGEESDYGRERHFDLYFTGLSVVTHEVNPDITHNKIRPGLYEVHVVLEQPSLLVLSESYRPNWVAQVNGQTIRSQATCEVLNGFPLEPGEYDITIEFVNSPLRTAGNLITFFTILIICGIVIFLAWRARRRRAAETRDAMPNSDTPQP